MKMLSGEIGLKVGGANGKKQGENFFDNRGNHLTVVLLSRLRPHFRGLSRSSRSQRVLSLRGTEMTFNTEQQSIIKPCLIRHSGRFNFAPLSAYFVIEIEFAALINWIGTALSG